MLLDCQSSRDSCTRNVWHQRLPQCNVWHQSFTQRYVWLQSLSHSAMLYTKEICHIRQCLTLNLHTVQCLTLNLHTVQCFTQSSPQRNVWHQISASLSLSSPWYNRNGWLGVKHQVTATITTTTTTTLSLSLSLPPPPPPPPLSLSPRGLSIVVLVSY